MTDSMSSESNSTISLRAAIRLYFICLAIFIVVLTVTAKIGHGTGWFAFFTYIGSGIYLNRVVLRRLVEWHSIYNTLENVTRAKLSTAIFWPFSYAFLFIKLIINKVL